MQCHLPQALEQSRCTWLKKGKSSVCHLCTAPSTSRFLMKNAIVRPHARRLKLHRTYVRVRACNIGIIKETALVVVVHPCEKKGEGARAIWKASKITGIPVARQRKQRPRVLHAARNYSLSAPTPQAATRRRPTSPLSSPRGSLSLTPTLFL